MARPKGSKNKDNNEEKKGKRGRPPKMDKKLAKAEKITKKEKKGKRGRPPKDDGDVKAVGKIKKIKSLKGSGEVTFIVSTKGMDVDFHGISKASQAIADNLGVKSKAVKTQIFMSNNK